MRWQKCDLWKACIAMACLLLLLLLMTWVPLSAASAHEGISGVATPGTVTVQTTSTANPTLAAETAQEQLTKLQRDNDRSWQAWFWGNAATLSSTLVVVIGALFGLWRWRRERQDTQDKELKERRDAQDKELKEHQNEREKRAEERFQAAVMGLGDDKERARIGAAVLLRTFLRPGYEQFYTQIFELAVAHLRLPITSQPSGISFNQALIIVFKDAFLLIRGPDNSNPQSLNAEGVRLDNAYFLDADLKQVWMPEAFLLNANLRRSKLCNANLTRSDLTKADLRQADLSGANLAEASFWGADLRQANLAGANLAEAICFQVRYAEM